MNPLSTRTSSAVRALGIAVALASMAAGPALADATESVRQDVRAALTGSGTVHVSVEDGVATLTGDGDSLDRRAAARAALAHPEIDRVVNLIDGM